MKVSLKAYLYLKQRLNFLLAQGNWRNCAHKMLVKLTPDELSAGVNPCIALTPIPSSILNEARFEPTYLSIGKNFQVLMKIKPSHLCVLRAS
jgi:hypothetical protein